MVASNFAVFGSSVKKGSPSSFVLKKLLINMKYVMENKNIIEI
jgi:hypothetical protein